MNFSISHRKQLYETFVAIFYVLLVNMYVRKLIKPFFLTSSELHFLQKFDIIQLDEKKNNLFPMIFGQKVQKSLS